MKGLSFLFLCALSATAVAKPPNIVMIMADDFGYECVGANGGTSYQTPQLDQMAKEGMRFEHCYAQPICTPSRVKLMTGIANVRNYIEFGLLDPKARTFAHTLKEAGYGACVVGKWQLGGDFAGPGKFGFDEYALWQLNRRPGRYPNGGLEINGEQKDYHNGEYMPDIVSDYACDFMKRQHAEGKPFLVYYPMILTHCPFEPTPDSKDWDAKSPGSKTYKGDPKYFGDMVTYMDKLVGKLIRTVDAIGEGENTLIVFVGDNGTDKPVVSTMNGREVPGAKGKTHDGGNRVPCIARWPKTIPAEQVSSEILDLSDFYPTFCELAGVDTPKNLDGRSLLPVLKGGKEPHRQWIYQWYSRNGKNKAARQFVRNQRYKLYADGTFYDIKNDVLEKKPLTKSALNEEQERLRKEFDVVLKRYHAMRPAHLGQDKPKQNSAKD